MNNHHGLGVEPQQHAVESEAHVATVEDSASQDARGLLRGIVAVVVLVSGLIGYGLGYDPMRAHVAAARNPAFASALAQSRAELSLHTGLLWNTDGSGEFADAGAKLCAEARGTAALAPVSAKALTYYPGGYDSQGINPPPRGVLPGTVAVPLAWTDAAVVPCRQRVRMAYFLLERDFANAGQLVVFAHGERRSGWQYVPSVDGTVLDRKALARALAAAAADDRDGGRDPDVHFDRNVADRLP